MTSLTITISDDFLQELHTYVEENKLNMEQFIRSAIKDYLQKQKHKVLWQNRLEALLKKISQKDVQLTKDEIIFEVEQVRQAHYEKSRH